MKDCQETKWRYYACALFLSKMLFHFDCYHNKNVVFVGLKAKMESDRLIVSVGKKVPQETGIKVKNHSSSLSLAHRRDFKQLLQGITGEGPLRLADINFKEFAGFQIALLSKVDFGQSGHFVQTVTSSLLWRGKCDEHSVW